MAEFQVVMRQARRMCATLEDCGRCRLVSRRMECPIEGMPQKWPTEPEILAEIEYIVMNWAEKNPEPRCPTWAEWLRMLGVEKLSDIIPADIAEKLGVKSIGGASDENA